MVHFLLFFKLIHLLACPDIIRTSLGSLFRSNCFSEYIWFLKLGISVLLVPIQRAHTYSNNPWIVVSEWHRCLAFERKGTAHFFIGGSDGAIITFKTSLVCPFRKAQVRLCGHSKEEAVKMGPLVILPLPALPLHLP